MKKLFQFSDKTASLIEKLDKLAHVISFLVLVTDTLKFLAAGLKKLKQDGKENEAAPAAGDVLNGGGNADSK